MNRTLLFSISAFLMFVGVALMGGSHEAVAGHGCHGCYGCYSSCSCSCSCYSGCYCSGCYCSGWQRRHARRAWRSCYGCSGCYGCYGCSVTCHGCYGCSAYYGCSCSCSCAGGTVIESYREVPADEAAPVDVPEEAASDSSGSLRVTVPAEAKIYINDRETTTAGIDRRYISRGLQQGVRYAYEVRAELDGQSQTRVVSLQAGRSALVAFDFDQQAPATAVATKTRLTVNVPADAQVSLAGTATRSQGKTRSFTTTKLSEGQAWENYTIVASVVRDGETVTKEQSIELHGGQDREISFDFGGDRVAQLENN